jgi:hypothetical protein
MPALRAPESALVQRGASPLQAYALRPETEGNCVAVRRGGEQPEVRDQSVERRTRFGLMHWRACGVKAKPRPAREAHRAEG